MRQLADFLLTVIGSGAGATLVGAWFKRKFDVQLQTQIAALKRNDRIHEQQVNALLQIHSNLDRALFYAQRLSASGRLEGESDTMLGKRLLEKLGSASDVFSANSLLFDDSLNKQLHEFFQTMLNFQILIGVLSDQATQGDARAKLWRELQDNAYAKLPPLLKAVCFSARSVIHR
ncbi:MAG TPA: hypothetical protein VEH50_10435 [Methylomirabilota bacterium]|nr:hypothetical protein [Methylomirabilota bacterium]